MNRASLSLLALGSAALAVGVWLLLPAAGLITIGALACAVGVLMLDDGRKQ